MPNFDQATIDTTEDAPAATPARATPVGEGIPMAENEHLWVLSNRRDDRVVLWERDSAHPGNEAFIAGSAPALVGRTGEVARLLREGLLIEVPEPRESPKKPMVLHDAAPAMPNADMPGQVIRLGRAPDPDLFGEGGVEQVQRQQEKLPAEVPVPAGVEMPPPPEPERSRAARR